MQQAEVAKKNYYPTSTGICQEFNNFKSVQRSIHLQGRQKIGGRRRGSKELTNNGEMHGKRIDRLMDMLTC